MIVEVTGTNTRNKGAELMLVAIKKHFRHLPDVHLAVDQFFGSYDDRARYALLQKLVTNGSMRSRLAVHLMPHEFKRAFGIVSDSDVDVVLDAAGFAFGDQHPAKRTLAFAARVEAARRSGKKVVLLPQALGPFERPTIRDGFARIIEAADLVYARDAASLKYVESAVGSCENVRVAPDITIGISPERGLGTRIPDNAAVIVPNSRMLDKMSPEQAAMYVPFLGGCLEAVERLGLVPVMLMHDAVEDHKIVSAVQKLLGRRVTTVNEDDPIRLKAIISQARLLVGSRFHALVAALSQGVPAIAAGWSHKYELLMEDFGCPAMLLEPSFDSATISCRLEEVVSAEADIKCRLQNAKERMSIQLESMWREVDAVLGCNSFSNDVKV